MHLAAECCRELDGSDLSALIPALGIPPDLSLIWDGVSIGGTMWSRGETMCIIGVGFCESSGHIQHRLLATPSENLQKTGLAQVDLVLGSLRSHPAKLSQAVLRSRLSVIGGDGAVCIGGAEHWHQSTSAAEKLWSAVVSDAPDTPCTEWDLFHRMDAALSSTM